MKVLLIVLTFLLSVSSLALAEEGHGLQSIQATTAQSQLVDTLKQQEWRFETDIFYLAATQAAKDAGTPAPKLPSECIEGFRCSSSYVCVSGDCVNGRCEC